MASSTAVAAPVLSRARTLYQQREYGPLVELLAAHPRGGLLAEPQMAFWLADAWRRLGESAAALELVRVLGPICERHGNDRLCRDRLNLEGMLLFERGEVAAAEAVWSSLLDASSRADDAEFVARACQNLGVAYTLRGDLDAAFASYKRALVAYWQRGYLRGIAQAHQNIAIIDREMERWRDADRHCCQAMHYAREDGSEDEVARAQQERALVLCLSGDPLLAGATAVRALQTWERLKEPGGIGGTCQVLGVVNLARGRLQDATQYLEHARSLARQIDDALLEAETLETLAAVALAAGDSARAGALQAEADPIFAAMGATAWGLRTRARLQALARSLPSYDPACRA